MTTKKMKLHLGFENTMKWLYTIAIFVTPFIFTTKTKEGFEFPKMFFVYFFGSTVLFLMLIYTAFKSKKLVFKNRWVLYFLIANIIATLFSSHMYTSLWGYYSRFNGGLVSTIIYIGIYFTATNIFKKASYEKILLAVALTSIPVSLYAIIQHFAGLIRVYSTFGQPNWLAAFSAMVAPLLLAQALKKNNQLGAFWTLSFVVLFAGIWLTYSISGLLGLAGGIIAFALLNLKIFKKEKTKLGIIAFLCLLIVSAKPGLYVDKAKDLWIDFEKRSFITKNVFASEGDYSLSDTGSIRKGLAKGSLKLIFENPKNFFIGTGPETFPYEFQKVRPKELNYSSEWDFILNKPHNYYLELWSQIGIFGLIAYLGIIFKAIKTKDRILVPSIVALLITNIFGWPTVTTNFLFWVFLAKLDTYQ